MKLVGITGIENELALPTPRPTRLFDRLAGTRDAIAAGWLGNLLSDAIKNVPAILAAL